MNNPIEPTPGIAHSTLHIITGENRVEVNVETRALEQFSQAEVAASMLLFMYDHPLDVQKCRIYQEGGRIMVAVQHRASLDTDFWDEVNTYVYSNNRWVHQRSLIL